jgi:hypothetical protein
MIEAEKRSKRITGRKKCRNKEMYDRTQEIVERD